MAKLAGRPMGWGEAKLWHEARRRLLRQAALVGAVDEVRGDLLATIAGLRQGGFAPLADDLQQRLDGEVSADAREGGPRTPTISQGTCFLVTPDGDALTAAHVVEGASTLRVRLSNGEAIGARPEAVSSANDLALLRLDRPGERFLPIALSGGAHVADQVFTFGFPAASVLGDEPKFTEGSVSALSGPGGEASLLQISVPVQPGNSGGPLVNDSGEVVGVITSTAALTLFLRENTVPQNVNWAVKADMARALLPTVPTVAPARNRAEAIRRVREAVCYVEATRDG